MLIEEALYQYLSTHPSVSPLVGGRIYPLTMPARRQLPAVTYQRISSTRVHTHEGPSGLAAVRIQYDAWAVDYAGARNVGEAIRGALDGFRGTVAGVRIDGILSENDRDLFEPETRLWRMQLDVLVQHGEA